MPRLKVKQPAFRFVRLQHKARLGADKIVIKVTDPESEQQAVAKAEVFFRVPIVYFRARQQTREGKSIQCALANKVVAPIAD